MAGKPDVRVVLKSKSTGASITLCSFWSKDGDRPSGGLDRRIKRIKVEWEDQDGTTHTELVTNAGKESSHYANLWMDAPGAAPARPAPAKAHPYRKPAADLPPDDGSDGDPYPF